MKNLFKPFVTAAALCTLALTASCGGENDDTSGNPGLITEDSARQLAVMMMSFKDIPTAITTGKSATNIKSLTGSTKAIIQTNCSVSGNYTYDDVTGDWAFNNCDDGLGPVNGSSSTSTVGTVTTSNFYITFNSGGAFINMSFTGSVDSAPSGAYDFDIDMSFSTPEGSLTIVTDPAFAGIGTNPPSSGSMLISAGAAKIQVNAHLSHMEIKVDEDGDNVYETTITENWTALGY